MKKTGIIISLYFLLFSCDSRQTSTSENKMIVAQEELQLDAPLHSENDAPKKHIHYQLVNTKEWLLEHELNKDQLEIAYAINRTDHINFSGMDSVVVPTDLNFQKFDYLPFPSYVDFLKDIEKIIFFSYPTQTFAAYACGKLLYSGPTNMGRKSHLTPTGLFFTNWKAKVSVSTVNNSWILRWNFNLINSEGIGFHQYSLPGYPASHSCLRLQENDAYNLYNWADQWVLLNAQTIKVKGTPVIIFGSYDFSRTHPWRQLIATPHGMEISEAQLQALTNEYLPEILKVQQDRQQISH